MATDAPTVLPAPPASTRYGPGRVLAIVIGALLAFVAVALLSAGGGLLWSTTQEDAERFIAAPSTQVASDGHAVVAGDVVLHADVRRADFVPLLGDAAVRISASPVDDADELFVGIGPSDVVEDYLDDVPRSGVATYDWPNATVDDVAGGSQPSVAPEDLDLWVASSVGAGEQELTWEVTSGSWTVVLMNRDASAGVAADVVPAARLDLLLPLAIGLLVAGLALGGLATLLVVLAVQGTGPTTPASGSSSGTTTPRDASPSPAGAAVTAAGTPGDQHPYPLRLEGRLDEPAPSRWLWLVKWVLLVPHVIVLGVLWVVFVVLTAVAGVAILVTGRYPSSLFDINVGILRWTWRVWFYGYGALGTDRYPPFALEARDHPATLEVEPPEELSRGLVLVKWWLLALPHYLVVAVLAGNLGWAIGSDDSPTLIAGGGLVGLLTLVAGISLLFTARYPRGLLDLVVGLDRWVFRVIAYAALMTDEYPPFRLDVGTTEPRPSPPDDGPSTAMAARTPEQQPA